MMSRFFVAVTALTIVFATFSVSTASARDAFRNVYAGVGLARSMAQYKSGSADSTFNGWGASAIAGFGFQSSTYGLYLEGEYGRVESLNTLQSTTYMEKSLNTFLAGKIGFSYEIFSLGVGAQQNTIDVDNVTTLGTSGRTSYKGLGYFGFARMTIDSRETFRTILEAKYGTGTFSGLEMNETSLNLRIVFLPF